MGKKELIEKWESKEGVPSYEISAFPVNPSLNEIYVAGYGVARKEILDDLKQLDEPKKVIFSHEEKFVADWLDGLRGQISSVKLNSGAVFMTFIGRQLERYYDEDYSFLTEKIESWLTVPKNKVKLLNAIDNGYEVEKEQLYYVFDPTVKQYLGVDKVLNEAFWLSSQNSGARIPLTEQEIKSVDERYWQFAVKVDGE
ncbi:DUF1642 domain-containing protein [Enterococcus faecalis]|nr:DUF1642 domain-containing protein [Enterococcus faecalis]